TGDVGEETRRARTKHIGAIGPGEVHRGARCRSKGETLDGLAIRQKKARNRRGFGLSLVAGWTGLENDSAAASERKQTSAPAGVVTRQSTRTDETAAASWRPGGSS